MQTQKKVAQSRPEATVQQSSPGKTKVPRLDPAKAPQSSKSKNANSRRPNVKNFSDKSLLKVKKAIRLTEEELAPKFTLEEAYDYNPCDRKEASAKGLMAVAYLLDSITDIGNEDLEGQIANGLAFAVRHFAGEVNDLVNPVQFRHLKWEFEELQKRCNEAEATA